MMKPECSPQKSADDWIKKLKLEAHPEGGYFSETYRSSETLPKRYNKVRSFSTAIYFLLKSGEVSAFHRLKSDEIWHFYEGSALSLFILNPKTKKLETFRLGRDPEKGETFQVVIPAGRWFGACVEDKKYFSLIGCTVAPGFDFEDFELAHREDLLRDYPSCKSIIQILTR